MMNRVFVLSSNGKPLMPCHPARARRLLKQGRATAVQRRPFTIRLSDRDHGTVQQTNLKLDPGSATTGIALVADFPVQGRRPIWAAELTHRSQAISAALAQRRAYRRTRRGRKCRNRPPRFNNRRRPAGWLPPSLRARVDQTMTWATRLIGRCPVAALQVETTRFDVSAMAAGRALPGVEYQRGTRHGIEVREYLLHRHGHRCAYCAGQSNDPILEIEHVQPKSRGGSDRIANLVIACRTCNDAKNNRNAGEWAAALADRRKPIERKRRDQAARIDAGARPSLRDAAAVNATRYAIGDRLKALGLPVHFTSGARTKHNRTTQRYPKAHWIDAACVGEAGDAVRLDPRAPVLHIRAASRGQRRICKVDRYGFPRTRAGRCKRVAGLQTGDLVRLRQPAGTYRGTHEGPLASVRATGQMDVRAEAGKITAPASRMQLLARFDGYHYQQARAD